MKKLKNFILRKIWSLLGTLEIKTISKEITRLREITENTYIDNYLKENLYENSSYINTKKITHFHKSVYAQNGEDGIIEEIFKRIGITNRYFVEFGVHGIKNNSTLLLLKGWSGLWIGGNEEGNKTINLFFKDLIDSKKLVYNRKWITEINIEKIFQSNNVPDEFDFLSIDLDGNDYWIWKAILNYSPRLVSIEYNSTIPSNISCVMAYNPEHKWDQTSYFGASLKALEKLGIEKGYYLIGCDFTGCNAFFLRKDQNLELFEDPYTAEKHYQPPRYFLRKMSGHMPGFGKFILP